MNRTKMRTSDLFEFESRLCGNCVHDDGEDNLCTILGILAMNGECEIISEGVDGVFGCPMRITNDTIPNVESINKWFETASTEEVEGFYVKIVESYHYDVFKKEEKQDSDTPIIERKTNGSLAELVELSSDEIDA